MVRKPYAPGIHGKETKRRKAISEYGIQLKEKRKLKSIYGLREKQLKNYVIKALEKNDESTSASLIRLIESRIDNVLFRAGFGASRSQTRQLINHGHVLVNKKRLTASSHSGRIGDKINLKESSLKKGILQNIDFKLKKHKPPEWLKINENKKEMEIISVPMIDEDKIGINVNQIIEFYLR